MKMVYAFLPSPGPGERRQSGSQCRFAGSACAACDGVETRRAGCRRSRMTPTEATKQPDAAKLRSAESRIVDLFRAFLPAQFVLYHLDLQNRSRPVQARGYGAGR